MTPVLDPGVDFVVGYFPQGVWYDYFTVRYTLSLCFGASTCNSLLHLDNKLVMTSQWSSAAQGDSVRSKGEPLRLPAPLDKINLHLREGSVIPSQVTADGVTFSYEGGRELFHIYKTKQDTREAELPPSAVKTDVHLFWPD